MSAIVAVLLGERDEEIGKTTVPPDAQVVKVGQDFFVRTTDGKRLTRSGTGVGVVYRLTEVYERRLIQK